MRLKLFFIAIALFVGVGSYGQVTLPHLDPINYTVSQKLQTQTGWTTLNSGDDLLVASGNLSYTGLAASTGNKVTFDAAGIDAAKLFTQQTTGTVYYSFLLNVTALGSLNTTGGYFTGFTEGMTTTFGATVWTRSDGVGFDIGINPKTTAANVVWTTGTTAINSTILVVVSYQIVAGTLNDVVKLWINPTPGGTEPTATLTATNSVASDLANINRILLRQDGTTSTPFIEMDELRVGTTWASIMPAATSTITTSTNSLSGFSYGEGYGPSQEMSYTISGLSLTNNITVTAPTNYEVSTTTGSGFADSLTLTQTAGVVNTTAIYVRLKSGLSTNTYSGTITNVSSGATQKDVSCNAGVTNVVGWGKLSTAGGAILQGQNYSVSAQCWEAGMTDSAGNGGISTWIGYSSNSSNPNTGTWTWVVAPYSGDSGNDDVFTVNLGATIPATGSYNFVARFQIGSGAYIYGGYSSGFWNGSTNIASVLTVNSNLVGWCNVQSPPSGSINVGGTFDVYTQVFASGITEAGGQGAGINGWLGYSSTNSDPSTGTWTWIPSVYNTDTLNNDEYKTTIPAGLAAGFYYYASRFQKTGSTEFKYGGFNGGFWNGTTNVNGVLSVDTVDWANLQSPSTSTIVQGSAFTAYGQVFEPGVTNISSSQGTGITVEFGISPIGSNSDPSSSTWTWITTSYNSLCAFCGDKDTNGIPDNDEYFATTGSLLTVGTYYYTFRYSLNGGPFMYGGYNSGGGGFWNGTTDVSGVLTVTSSTCINEGFSAAPTAPTGWIFTGISSTYTSAGNYGAAIPSVRMDDDNDVITTEVLPTGNSASQLTFWIKGQGINTGSTSALQVDGYDGSTWTNIETINSTTLIASSGTAVTKTYNSGSSPALTSGFLRFRFTYKKDVGNLAIDDITVNCTTTTVNIPVVTASAEIGTVGSAYSYYVSATNFPTSYAVASGSLPPGLSFNTTTGQISGAPTTVGSFSISVTATNSGGTSAPATISFDISAYVAGCYNVNFEDGAAKSAYVSDNVTLSGKLWNLSETLVGNLAGDFGTSTYAVRMRSNFESAATLIQDKANGIGTISFNYKKYSGVGAFTNQVFNVEYSKDSGNTWIYIGNISPSSTTIAPFSATVNQPGPIRVRIVFASGTEDNDVRLNVDILSVCDYISSVKEIEVYGNATAISNNSVTVSESNNTYFSAGYFIGVDIHIVKTFVITNNGTGTLNLSGLSLSSTSYYTITSALSNNALTAGQSATFSITFSSTDTGEKSATVTITNDDSDEGLFNFLITTSVYNYVRCTLQPLSYIAQQDFDSNIAYTYTSGASNLNTIIAGGTNYGNSRSAISNMFIDSKSFQSSTNLNTITFSPINTQNHQNIELSFNLGAYATSFADGMETSDYVLVSISIDGGNKYYQQLKITGNNNSIFDINNGLSTNVAKYKINSSTPARFGTLNNSTNTLGSSFKITNLPIVADLRVKITFLSNKNLEVWAIDNIAIKGQLPLTTTWTTSGWSSSAPTSSTKAIFDENYTTSLTNPSVNACECLINANKIVTISTGDYLAIQSDLTNNGELNINDKGSLVQVNDDAVNIGDIDYIRTTNTGIYNTDYTYWSSPVFGFTLGEVSRNNTLPDKYYSYEPTVSGEGWKQESTSTEMLFGKGYIIRGPEYTPTILPGDSYTATFVGVPNNGSKLISPIYPDKSYLLGNPYPSALDADTFLAANSNVLDGTLYFWTHKTPLSLAADISNPGPGWAYTYSLNDYAAYNPVGGVGIDDGAFLPGGSPAPNGSAKPTGKIASGQGFFASTKTTLSGSSIVYNNSMRVGVGGITGDNSQFFKTRNTKEKTTKTIEKHRIWLNLTNTQGAFKQTLVGYITDATNEYDNRFDGESFDAHEFVDFYSVNQEKNLVIQGRALPFNENDEVPLGFRTTITGSFTINIDQVDGALTNQSVFIEDKLTNTVFDLKTANYTFNTVAGTFNDRFVLRYTNKTLSNNNFDTLENQVLVSNKNKQIKVNVTTETIDKVTIYDLLGRLLFKKDKVDSNELTIPNLVSSQQTLLVKVSLQNGQTITKKIIY